MTVLTLTSRGQLTLNMSLQQHLGVRPGDQIEVAVMPNGRLEISAFPKRTRGGLEAFFGSLENEHNIHASLDEIKEAIEMGWAGQVNLDDDR